MCWSVSFSKAAVFQPATLLKKRVRQNCFPTKFLGIPIM